jgi:hypothetical protein
MLVKPWSFIERYAAWPSARQRGADAVRMSINRLAEDAKVTCHRTFSQGRRLIPLTARCGQQARDGAGLGCAAERLLGERGGAGRGCSVTKRGMRPRLVVVIGPDGADGMEPAIPGLVGLHASYISAQLGAFRYGIRTAPAPDCMQLVAARLTESDVTAVAVWLASLPLPSDSSPVPKGSLPMPFACGSELLPSLVEMGFGYFVRQGSAQPRCVPDGLVAALPDRPPGSAGQCPTLAAGPMTAR